MNRFGNVVHMCEPELWNKTGQQVNHYFWATVNTPGMAQIEILQRILVSIRFNGQVFYLSMLACADIQRNVIPLLFSLIKGLHC